MPQQLTEEQREKQRLAIQSWYTDKASRDVDNLINLGASWGQKLYPHQAKGPLSDFEPSPEDVQRTLAEGVNVGKFEEAPNYGQAPLEGMFFPKQFSLPVKQTQAQIDKFEPVVTSPSDVQPANIPDVPWGSWDDLNEQGKMDHMFQVVQQTMEEDEDFRSEVEYDMDQALVKRIPFIGAMVEAKEQITLGERAERITKGDGTPRDYLELAKVMHNADYWEKEANIGERAASNVSSIATFGAEFYFTAGTGTLARAVGRGAAAQVVKKTGLNALIKKYAGAAARKLASPTNIKRAVVMGPAMATGIYHGGRENIGDLEATKEGGFQFAEEEDYAAVDVLESMGMAYAELAIEEFLPHGWVSKLTGRAKNKLVGGIGKLLSREAAEQTGKGLTRKAAFGGLLEELTEERMVEVANTIIARDTDELGVLGGDEWGQLGDEALAMGIIQSPQMVSALIPGRSRQQRFDRQTPTEPPTLEEGEVDAVELQEVIPEEEQAPPVELDEATEQQIDNLAREDISSRREFENVQLPDGTTLQDRYKSKVSREEFLEQRRAEIAARETEQAPVEEKMPPVTEEAPAETQEVPTEEVAPVEEEAPATTKPYQQTEDEYIQSVSQGDVVNIEDPQMTDHEMNVLGGESKNVKMPVSSQQLPYLVKENPDGDLVAVVDNQVVGYARTVDGALDLHVANEFKDHGMEQELVTLFQDQNPNIENITNNARDTLLAGHALSVDQALKSGQPVPVGVAKIREAQQRVEATQAKIDDGRKVTPQLRAALTRGQDNLDRARVEFGEAIPDRASRVDELAQRAEEGRDLFTGEPLEGMEAAEAAVPKVTKPKGSTIAQFRAERAEQSEQEIEPPPAVPAVDGSAFYAHEIFDAESVVREQEKILSEIESPTKKDTGPLILATNKLEGLKARKAAIEAPSVEEAEFGDDPVSEENAVAVGQINAADVQSVFPGRKVIETGDGNFDVHLKGGRWRVLIVDKIEKTKGQLTAIYNAYVGSPETRKWSKDKSGKWQTFEEVFPTVESYIESDPTLKGLARPSSKEELKADATWDVLGTIEVARGKGTAQQIMTLSHEAVHAAHLSGLWTDKEWALLAKTYSKPGRTTAQQSEDIAKASQGEKTAWEDPDFMERMVDWINRMLSKIGLAEFKRTSCTKHVLSQCLL